MLEIKDCIQVDNQDHLSLIEQKVFLSHHRIKDICLGVDHTLDEMTVICLKVINFINKTFPNVYFYIGIAGAVEYSQILNQSSFNKKVLKYTSNIDPHKTMELRNKTKNTVETHIEVNKIKNVKHGWVILSSGERKQMAVLESLLNSRLLQGVDCNKYERFLNCIPNKDSHNTNSKTVLYLKLYESSKELGGHCKIGGIEKLCHRPGESRDGAESSNTSKLSDSAETPNEKYYFFPIASRIPL
ncbi:hypothetical protein DICPUDRAFT_147570 [Dictyostelium purpureum]|uniref:Uncharacterized protein n=1 Tax=Dictyostelium purpureum TaxID=5786 RepID=F0Z8U5_DICPU|nr:uncharacterized protein DICPUDRAFT_147570 [Dictyostelium purpureum]EGC39606.1 hypothetical protein DICPUDRAFT_147570 [Dictyostelium purpureum]|eukprot:XP_003283827.1 hypothetical protein DICPUDRAFT_147570 [Dictyostelium purpureum]